ncbi:permease-like cell division protein FtsX [Nakamurella lactea]|uniref:permease-like cell division protein FtsX n=1 Tax=Nakamurella lactea TaxID=459515 RepID=UPI000408D4B1|nr:permease-like cell division protein FtsX [Nakamurella lactea]
MRGGYVFSEVLTGLRRNITMTIAMILTTAISLGLLGGGILVARMTSHAQQLYGDKVQVDVYLTPEVSANDPDCRDVCLTLKDSMQNNPDIASVEYHSQEDAYNEYKERFAGQKEMLDIVRKEALSAFLRVRLKDPAKISIISEQYSGKPGVRSVSDQRELLNRVFSVLNGVRNATLAIALVQAIAALLLISNMVQIAAFTRRTETSIMRLVGASRWRTQLPFVIEAVVAGVIGAVLAVGGLIAAKVWFVDKSLSSVMATGVLPPITANDMLIVAPILIGSGIVLAAVSAYLTLRAYVRT